MNICCTNDFLDPTGLKEFTYNDIKVKTEEGIFIFNNSKGNYQYKNTELENKKKSKIEELEKILEEKEKKTKEHKKKIEELDLKLKDMKKIVIMDIKENQYITLIGKKTEEKRKNEEDNEED